MTTALISGRATQSPGRGRRPRRSRATRPSVAFALPLVAFLGVFVAYPMAKLVQMSVSTVNPSTILHTWPFVGLANFRHLFADPEFHRTVWRTVIFAVVVLVIGVSGGLVSALSLQGRRKFGAFTYALLVLMWTLPPIVSGSTWKFLLSNDGFINELLVNTHLVSQPVLFLIDGWLPLLSVAFAAGWVCLPFATIAFKAALLDIPRERIEAAEVDGAGPLQRFAHVTWPHLRPTTYVVSILIMSYAVRSFDFAYVMTQGGPGTASTTLPLLGYSSAFTAFNYSTGAAIAVVTIVVVMLFALPYARTVGRRE
jgi:multiple sugar transport system permease protein